MEHHFHAVDPWAGGSKKEYIDLLVEAQGLSPLEAAERADVEEVVSGEPYFGADMGRFSWALDTASGGGEGCESSCGDVSGWGFGTSVAVDIRLPSRPKVLVSTFCLVEGLNLVKGVEEALAPWKFGSKEGSVLEVGISQPLAALASALPKGSTLTAALHGVEG